MIPGGLVSVSNAQEQASRGLEGRGGRVRMRHGISRSLGTEARTAGGSCPGVVPPSERGCCLIQTEVRGDPGRHSLPGTPSGEDVAVEIAVSIGFEAPGNVPRRVATSADRGRSRHDLAVRPKAMQSELLEKQHPPRALELGRLEAIEVDA